jgi:hypothetical protein
MENAEMMDQPWQVETGGQVYETNFEEMQAWIAEGSLLRIDRVRKGNLRWIEAGKVPQLVEFFNAKDAGEPSTPVITTTNVEVLGVSLPSSGQVADTQAGSLRSDVCAMHPDVEAAFACDTCANSFCKACPTGYGATVKICPFCGAMCRLLSPAAVQAQVHQESVREYAGESFGFSDFGRALAYPFKFKVSLVIGALMFAAFSIGSGGGGFAGLFGMVGGIVCLMCSNMLSFGVLANTVENFTQGKLSDNFMPSFDDFSLWDDVVHPFFLSIGVYISSFGPLIAVFLVAIFMVAGAVKTELNGFQDDAARAVHPGLPYAAKAASQSQEVRDLVKDTQNYQQERVEQLNKGEIETDEMPKLGGASFGEPSEEDLQQIEQMIQDHSKGQLESVVGKTPETKAAEEEAFFQELLGYGAIFLVAGGLCLIWGLFYFPAACAVAGYTGSFGATLNPAVGLDTIKRLGGSYGSILLMGLILLIVSSIVSGVLNMVFFAFDLPGLGNLPAKFFGSMFGFYISVVFSCILGYALFKKADKLALPA